MTKSTIIDKLLRLVRDESGSELVEFAMTALAQMFILIGVFQVMLAMYAYHFATYAAQRGARFAVVRGYTWSKNVATNCSTSAPPSFTMPYNCTASSTDIQNYVQSLATPGLKQSNITINTTNAYVWPGATPSGSTTPCATHANSQGCLVKVSVTYSVNIFPFLGATSTSIGATSEKAIQE